MPLAVCFYSNARQPLAAAVEWLAARGDERVVIYAPQPQTERAIDRLLWTHLALSFIPHCAIASPLAAHTPLLIARNAGELQDPLAAAAVLVNLDEQIPPPQALAQYPRIVEFVGQEEAARAAARARYRAYREAGCTLEHVSLTQA